MTSFKKIICPLAIILASFHFSLAQEGNYHITGSVPGMKKGKMILNTYGDDDKLQDTVQVKNSTFEFSGKVNQPTMAVLTSPGIKQDYLQFYLEPGDISILIKDLKFAHALVSGSRVNEEDKLLKDNLKLISEWEEKNMKLYESAAKEKNNAVLDSLNDVDFEVMDSKRKIISQFVADHPDSYRAALAIPENYSYYAEATDVEPLYAVLSPEVKSTAAGEKIKKMIDVYKTVAIGQTVPDIRQETPEGQSMNLSDLRGKYVLVDFWASWCGPCRRENPNLVNAYKQFKGKDFTVFSVSYDNRKDRWQKAIADDKLTWSHVSDLEGWKNATSDQFGIKAIPSNILVDKDGKIIAKNLFGKKLVEELASLN